MQLTEADSSRNYITTGWLSLLNKATQSREEVGSPGADQSTIKLVSDLAIQIDANNNKGDNGNGGNTNGGNGDSGNTGGGDNSGDGSGGETDPNRFNDDDGAFQMSAMVMALSASVAAIAF